MYYLMRLNVKPEYVENIFIYVYEYFLLLFRILPSFLHLVV